MGYFIAAIVLGMLIWAGFEIVQTIRNWEPNPEETTSKIQAEMVQETYRGQFGADALEATCESAPSAIGHVVEGLLHVLHH